MSVVVCCMPVSVCCLLFASGWPLCGVRLLLDGVCCVVCGVPVVWCRLLFVCCAVFVGCR